MSDTKMARERKSFDEGFYLQNSFESDSSQTQWAVYKQRARYAATAVTIKDCFAHKRDITYKTTRTIKVSASTG